MASAKQICADARTLAKEMNFSDPNDVEVLRYAEMGLQKIGKLLQGIDSRIYGQTAVLNVKDDANAVVEVVSGATYVVASKTITKASAFADAAVNGNGVIVGYIEDGSYTFNFFAYAVSKTDDTLVLDRDIGMGLITTPTTLKFLYFSSESTGSPTLSIDGLDVGDISMVTGSKAGNMKVIPLEEFLSVGSNPNYDNSGVVAQQGTNLLTYAGSGLTGGLGIVFVFYKRRPRSLAEMTDTVDLPIKYHAVLRDEVAKTLIIRRGMAVPAELKNPVESLEAQAMVMQKDAPTSESK